MWAAHPVAAVAELKHVPELCVRLELAQACARHGTLMSLKRSAPHRQPFESTPSLKECVPLGSWVVSWMFSHNTR